jgi:hypothetical protein
MGTIPYSSSGTPFDRSRFAAELEAKPWLKEKIKHISLGENQDPRANAAVVETLMNRAIVRGTSLEAQARRHRSSGEGGYYAGWAPHYSSDKSAMFDRNLDQALKGVEHHQLCDRQFVRRSSRPREGVWRVPASYHHQRGKFLFVRSCRARVADRWQNLNKRATDFEQNRKVAAEPGMPEDL